jgi:hypothetical protein
MFGSKGKSHFEKKTAGHWDFKPHRKNIGAVNHDNDRYVAIHHISQIPNFD